MYLDIYHPCDQSMFCGVLMDFIMICMICMVIYDIYQHCHHKPRSSWQCNATSRILPYPQSIWMKIKEPSMVPCSFMFFLSLFYIGLSSGFGGMIPSRERSHIRSQEGTFNSCVSTPWKINMEHTNHPFRKENDLPNPYDYVPC